MKPGLAKIVLQAVAEAVVVVAVTAVDAVVAAAAVEEAAATVVNSFFANPFAEPLTGPSG
jgi:hypothetical protein